MSSPKETAFIVIYHLTGEGWEPIMVGGGTMDDVPVEHHEVTASIVLNRNIFNENHPPLQMGPSKMDENVYPLAP